MNYLDIIFIIIIVSCTFWGLKKGLIKVVGGIIGIFVGIYFAGLLYSQVSDWLMDLLGFSSQTAGDILGYIVVFIVANRLFALLILILDKIFSLPIIGGINRILGGIFGLIEGVLIVSIITIVLSNLAFIGADSVLAESKIVPLTNPIFEFIKPIFPKGFESISNIITKAKEIDTSAVQDVIDTGSMTIDELINYLNADGRVQQDIIDQIKENALQEQRENASEYIKEKFQEYLDTLDSI